MDRKLPIGIQGFEKLRTENFIYVDKTEYIHKLVHNGVPYFLSRPRRFGKSLLLSTLKAYWEGKKELFAGLAMEKLESTYENSWRSYPVFYFDFNGANYQEPDGLERKLSFLLEEWERKYEIPALNKNINERFQNLLKVSFEKSGLRAVILVDEYDKPLMDVIDRNELQEHNKKVFKGFFSTLKSHDEYIQFIFITGVSKFHKVSIFSDLNMLNDISINEEYSGLCGITEDEIKKYFTPEITVMAARRGLTNESCLEKLRKQYDGYHFHPDGVAVFNPYSLLKAFYEKDFGAYWFETGTPTFLINKLREENFDIRKLTNQTIFSGESNLKDYTGDSLDPIPLLYQTGYITIADYDSLRRRYTLCFPNDEVKYGFLESLMPSYVPKATAGNGLDIFTLDDHIENGRLNDIKNVLTALFANITYTLESAPFEHYFQTVIYLVFTLLGKLTICEMHTFSGRIDCKVETKNYIYLFEFKRDDTAEAALKQIETKEYDLPFSADQRKLYKIGVAFDSQTRKLVDWKVAE